MNDWIGYAAAFCTTAAFFPQARQVWITRRTRDLSLPMFMLFCTGVLLWLAYGIALASLPMIIANILTIILAGYILFMKLTEHRRPQ